MRGLAGFKLLQPFLLFALLVLAPEPDADVGGDARTLVAGKRVHIESKACKQFIVCSLVSSAATRRLQVQTRVSSCKTTQFSRVPQMEVANS